MIKKERNMLVIYMNEEETKPYKINLTNGIVYGKSGREIKTVNNLYRIALNNCDASEELLDYLEIILTVKFKSLHYHQDICEDYYAFLERLYSYCVSNNSFYKFKYKKNLLTCDGFYSVKSDSLKKSEKYFKIIAEKVLNTRYYISLDKICLETYARKECTTNETEEKMFEYMTNSRENIEEIIDLFMYMKEYNKVDYFYRILPQLINIHRDSIESPIRSISDIISYVRKSKKLNLPLEKGNFLVNYLNVTKMYEIEADKEKNNSLKLYKEENKNLLYENEKYIVILPSSVEDFKEEACQQHNCVYTSYLDRVIRGYSKVVFIRSKENIEKSLITCEISSTGYISQYYEKYNQMPSSQELIDFQKEYQEYLSEIFR